MARLTRHEFWALWSLLGLLLLGLAAKAWIAARESSPARVPSAAAR